VVALGPGVDSVRIGDRILAHIAPACGRCGACLAGRDNLCQKPNLPGIHCPGGYAELAVVSAWGMEGIPPQLSFQEAAAVPIAFGTAWHMLITRGRLRAGETVLIQAAGSTIGSAAIQVAHLAGARVITTAGSDAKLAKAKALGAHETINYREEDLVAAVRRHTDGRGVDLVFEHIGARSLPRASPAWFPAAAWPSAARTPARSCPSTSSTSSVERSTCWDPSGPHRRNFARYSIWWSRVGSAR
jgi:NADPH:quinone reductase-like Zn-dependent oxidoreductase